MSNYKSGEPSQLTDADFIQLCYQKILQRNPDQAGQSYYLSELGSGRLSREKIVMIFLSCDELDQFRKSLEFVPPGHFFSALPSIREREEFLASTPSAELNVPGVNLNAQGQRELLWRFKRYYDDCRFPEVKTEPARYYLSNPAFSYADALTLQGMIRHFRPKRIIEIGSGFSSCVMLDTNEQFCDGKIDLTFVEPYPALLHSLLRPTEAAPKIIPARLQDVDLDVFRALETNDILFVDSTHVSKLNSDVNRIFFEILPALQTGTLIHFHDIFLRFEYSKEWIREGRAWNEAYLLRAFLQYNKQFEVIFFLAHLLEDQRDWLEKHMPMLSRRGGGNIWLRKI